jgi:hypothetical protein
VPSRATHAARVSAAGAVRLDSLLRIVISIASIGYT